MQHEDISTNEITQTQQSENDIYVTSVSQKIHYEDFFTNLLLSNVGSSVYSTQYLTEDMFLGLGCADGAIRVMSTSKGDIQYILRNDDNSPVSCISLNPNSSQIKNSLMATHTEGTVQYWHATSQQLLFSKKYDQLLHCCQISRDGHYYVFAGDKGHMKIGALSKGNPSQIEVGNFGAHENRVFCLKWNQYDNNMFFSGGWDKTVYVWDVRTKTAIGKIFGIYMGGSAIDVNSKHQLLLGNNTNEMPLRIYDMKTLKARLVDWKSINEEELHHTTGVLSCYFGQTDQQILAVSPYRDIRLFKQDLCVSRHETQNHEKRIFTLSKSESKRSCAIGWNNGDIQILQY